MSKISDLIAYAKADTTNTYQEVNFDRVPNFQAQAINQETGIKINGATKILSSYAITHIIKEHGTDSGEVERGQKCITDEDFELIPEILKKPDTISKGNKNSRMKDTIIFEKNIKNYKYFLIMSVSRNKEGVRIFVNTFYAKKKPM